MFSSSLYLCVVSLCCFLGNFLIVTFLFPSWTVAGQLCYLPFTLLIVEVSFVEKASLVAQSVCLQCGRPGFDPWVGKIPWRRTWQPTPVFLPGESHGRRSLVGYSPWGRKESDVTERLHLDLFWFFFRFINLSVSVLFLDLLWPLKWIYVYYEYMFNNYSHIGLLSFFGSDSSVGTSSNFLTWRVVPSVLCNSLFVHAPSVGTVFSWIISWVLVVKVSLALILAESQGFQRSFVLIYLLWLSYSCW